MGAALLLTLVLVGCNPNGGPLVLSGTLETDDHDVIAPATAQILTLSVREGDAVTVGDTIGVLDTVTAASAYRVAIAAEREAAAWLADFEAGSDLEKIRAAEAERRIAAANAEQSRREYRRSDSLHQAGLIDAQTLERSALTRDNAQSSLQVAEERLADLRRGARVYQIEAAQAAWERATADLVARRHVYEQLFLTAGHSGVVQWLPYQIGEYVPAGRTVATIHNPTELWAKVYMPEAHLDQVVPGDTVLFAVDAHPDERFEGVVLLVSATAEFTPRNVQTPDERLNLVYAVKLAVAPDQNGLRAGMPADFFFD